MRKLGLACLWLLILAETVVASRSQQSSPAAATPAPHTTSGATPGGGSSEPAQTSAKPAERHSTPEDRQRLVAIAHKLEAAPLDPALAPERGWAVGFVVAAADIHVRICPTLLADLRRPRYKYKSEMIEQLLISSAAFLIEHPDHADDNLAQSLSGMEGVLKAYSAILKAEPQATAKSLDDLLQKQAAGKLADAVSDIVKQCQRMQISSRDFCCWLGACRTPLTLL